MTFVEKIPTDDLEQWTKLSANTLISKLIGPNNIDTVAVKKVTDWIQSQIPMRVILLGPQGAGKTTFIQLMKGHIDNENDESLKSSLNRFTFWDLGEQESYKTQKLFLADECQYILVVDLSNFGHESEHTRNEYFMVTDYWMKEIHKITADGCSPPVIILGTHCDLLSDKTQEVKELVLKLVKRNQLNCVPFVFESSLNVSDLNVNGDGGKILNQIQKNSDEYFKNDNIIDSLRLITLKQKIETQRETKPFMLQKELATFFEEQNKTQISKYQKFLKMSGICGDSFAHSEIVLLDPQWFSQLFTAISTIDHSSSLKNKAGLFTSHQIDEIFNQFKVSQNIRRDILKILSILQLIILLPSEEYFIPSILRRFKEQSNVRMNKTQIINVQFKEKNMEYECVNRKYKFKHSFPFEEIDKLVLKCLHFPGLSIHESSSLGDIYLHSIEHGEYDFKSYHVLIQTPGNNIDTYTNNELVISIYHPKEEKDKLYFSWFQHFIFRDIVGSIEKISIIDPEDDTTHSFSKFTRNLKHCFLSSDVQVLNEKYTCKFVKKLRSEETGEVCLGKMTFDSEDDTLVELKEAKSDSFKLINEIMVMKIIENRFTKQLLGIYIPSENILETKRKISVEFLKDQLLMVTELAGRGDLVDCRENIQSMNLKLKIALDVARGLHSLCLNSGVDLIHRDVKAENVFIFSLDEESISSPKSVHAKLGGFGSVVHSPCSQTIDNYPYTAPEAMKPSLIPYSKAIDVYSFGILFWEILTGKRAFQELKETRENTEQMIIDGYRPSLDILPNDTHSCIVRILKDCWSSKAYERPTLGKIISVLTLIQLQIENEREIEEYLPSFESYFETKEKIIGNNIEPKIDPFCAACKYCDIDIIQSLIDNTHEFDIQVNNTNRIEFKKFTF